MRARRLGSALAAIVLVTVLAIAMPSSANGASVANPVAPVPVLPSAELQALVAERANYPVGSIGYNELTPKINALMDAGLKAAQGDTAAVAIVEKGTPITAAAKWLRPAGGVAGGAALMSFNVGWILGQEGLGLYAAATGTDYLSMACSQPDWYQAVNGVMMMGVTPDCSVKPLSPNGDQTTTYAPMTYGGFTSTFLGVNAAYPTYGCYEDTGTMPTGYGQWDDTAGYPPGTGAFFGGAYDATGCGSTGANRRYQLPSHITIRKQSDPTKVVASYGTTQANPVRTLSCEITWSDGTKTQGPGHQYQESGAIPMTEDGTGCRQAWFMKGSRPSPGGGGVWPSKIDVKSAIGTGTPAVVSSQTVPAYTDAQKAAIMPAAGASGGLVLRKTVNGVTDSCMTWAASCAGWWAATSNGTVPTTGTTTYTCTYNGAAVALTECAVYQTTFETQTNTPPLTNTASGDQVATSSSPDPANSGASTEDPGGQCMAEWPSAPDPISWVLHPVKCALVWAFVPRTSAVTQVQTNVVTAWSGTVVGQIAAVLPTWFTVPSGSGCAGPHVEFTVEWPMHFTFRADPLNACTDPVATIATLCRLIASIIVIGQTIWGVSRRISAIVSAQGVGPGDGS